jgi:hypothetical protein
MYFQTKTNLAIKWCTYFSLVLLIKWYVKLIHHQFWCTRCIFRLLKCLPWCSGRKSWKSQKTNKKTVKEPSDENQRKYHKIEPNPSKDRSIHEGDNPSVWNEFKIKVTLFSTAQCIMYFKASIEVLRYWAVKICGD